MRALWQRERFEWGRHDCILAVCNYVATRWGVDPAAPWRGSYRDEAGAQAILDRHGGLFSLFDLGMTMAGFERTEPATGLPVVCVVAGHEVAGIAFGRRVGFVAERGMIEGRAEPLAAWAPCRL